MGVESSPSPTSGLTPDGYNTSGQALLLSIAMQTCQCSSPFHTGALSAFADSNDSFTPVWGFVTVSCDLRLLDLTEPVVSSEAPHTGHYSIPTPTDHYQLKLWVERYNVTHPRTARALSCLSTFDVVFTNPQLPEMEKA